MLENSCLQTAILTLYFVSNTKPKTTYIVLAFGLDTVPNQYRSHTGNKKHYRNNTTIPLILYPGTISTVKVLPVYHWYRILVPPIQKWYQWYCINNTETVLNLYCWYHIPKPLVQKQYLFVPMHTDDGTVPVQGQCAHSPKTAPYKYYPGTVYWHACIVTVQSNSGNLYCFITETVHACLLGNC